VAEEPSKPWGACPLTGTWYGGSDAATYQLTVIPHLSGFAGPEEYTCSFVLGDPLPPPTTIATPATGSIRQRLTRKGLGYDLTATVLVNTPDGQHHSVLAVHGRARLDGCDTLVVSYDLFGGYFWPTTKTPLLDEPDFPAAPVPFVETYRRMPQYCKVCSAQ
jgi:hypothetical protein